MQEPPIDVMEALVAEVPEVFSIKRRKGGTAKLRIANVRKHENKLERVRF